MGETRCGLIKLAELLEKIRDLGVYDQTTLLFLSDHGENDLSPWGYYPRPQETSYLPGEELKYDAVLMVKPTGRKGKMIFDESRVSLLDVRNTLCAAMAKCQLEGLGLDLASGNIPKERRRPIVHYRHHKKALVVDRLQTGYYQIINFDGSTSDLPKALFNPTRKYGLGKKLLFGKGQNGDHYLFTGWAFPKEKGRWTDTRNGRLAKIVLPMKNIPQSALILEISLAAYHQRQDVVLEVNDRQVATLDVPSGSVSAFKKFSVCVPFQIASGHDTLRISMMPSKPASPALVEGRLYDELNLGMLIKEMTVRPARAKEKCITIQ